MTIKTEYLFGAFGTCFRYQMLGEIFEDSVVALLVCFSKIASSYGLAHA